MSRKRSAAPASLVCAVSTGAPRSTLATCTLTGAARKRPVSASWRTSPLRIVALMLAFVSASSL